MGAREEGPGAHSSPPRQAKGQRRHRDEISLRKHVVSMRSRNNGKINYDDVIALQNTVQSTTKKIYCRFFFLYKKKITKTYL